MRILFLSSFYPPYELGGVEQLCHEAAHALSIRGHPIHVLTSRFGMQSGAELNADGVTRTLYLQADNDFYRPLDFFLKRRAQERFNSLELRRVIDEFSPDACVVWGMWNWSWNVPYTAEQRLPGRVGYYIASYWPEDADLHSAYWRRPANHSLTELVKRGLRSLALSRLKNEGYPPPLKFEHAVCCSQYVRDRLVGVGKLPAAVGVIYAGMDQTPFLPLRSDANVLDKPVLGLIYFGRLIHDKGVHTAIEAISVLKQRGLANRVQLTIVGDGHPDYKAYLHECVEKGGIAEYVHFAGRVSRVEIPRLLRGFDVFLFTSIWPEPFGRTIIEAMLAGLVVIGSDVGGSREIFADYDQELLFPAGDAMALADRISRLIQQPEIGPDLVRRGRELVIEKFSMDQFVDQIERFISDLSFAGSD